MRLALNEYDVKVREELIKILSSIGSIINVDDAGNIRGSIRGKSDDCILIGSHMDSVPNGGKYNGFYGVIAGLEILRSVKDLNITTNIQFH
jgi:N-carbamoyl-L-amino-acid hydrolase